MRREGKLKARKDTPDMLWSAPPIVQCTACIAVHASHAELPPSVPYPSLHPAPAHTACLTLLGLCPFPDSSDSELELSTVRHQPEGLDQLQTQTKFTKKELQSLYRGFKNVSAPLQRPSVPDSTEQGPWPREPSRNFSGAQLLLLGGRPCEGHCAPFSEPPRWCQASSLA